MSDYILTEGDFGEFFEVPLRQYGSGEQYVSPFRSDLARMLDGARNPVFGDATLITYFTVSKGGHPLGRITAHIHRPSNARYGTASGSFGFFDCADDAEAARLLLGAASEWLARRGCDRIAGNFNLTAMQEMGVVVDGHHHAPFLAQHHNPAWIPRLLEQNAFEPFFPMTSWRLDVNQVDLDGLIGPKQRELLDSGSLTMEPIRRRHFRRSIEATRELLNSAFDENDFFVPMSRDEFRFQSNQMLWVLDPCISYLARMDREPVGVIACLPDLNPMLRATGSRLKASTPLHFLRSRRKRTRASLIFGGVSPARQNQGLAAILLLRALQGMRTAGYNELGITWISDSNTSSLRQMEKLGAKRLHRLYLFQKKL